VAVGLSATVSIGSRRYTVLAVRPPSATVDGDAIEAVSAAVKDQPGTASLVLASFNAKAGAADALKAWTKAGLADPRAGNAATYPAAKPAERADFVLVSAGMRSQVKSYRVIRDRRLAEVSAHLPVAVTLRR
jgi:endonuclease/exonuclease/phosphatase family metal-dependent hydrolase